MHIEKFTIDEIMCNCGCGFIIEDEKFIEMLTAARIISGVTYRIRSWCRCSKHNKDEGGKETSGHRRGIAADIETLSSYMRFRVYYGLIMAGFRRIGHGKDFLHADIDIISKFSPCIFDY